MAFKFVAYIEFSTLYYFDLGGREGGREGRCRTDSSSEGGEEGAEELNELGGGSRNRKTQNRYIHA